MLSIAINEQDCHFEHGLKIIITRLTDQWHQDIQFLPIDCLDTADIALVSLDEEWFSADCDQVPVHTQHQQRIIICNKTDKEKLMFKPCLYMLPHIYREDDVDEITRKMVLILQKRALRHSVPPAICHYCTTRHFSILERQLLKFTAKGYSLMESAGQLSLTEEQTKSLRRRIMRKLHIKNDQQFLNYIRVNLNFLQE